MVVSIIAPYRLAYVDDDSRAYEIADNIINVVFLVDLILNFFMAYFNKEQEIIIN
jgi:hypothetical protein